MLLAAVGASSQQQLCWQRLTSRSHLVSAPNLLSACLTFSVPYSPRAEAVDETARLQAIADVENKKREKAIAKHASEWL